MELHFLPPSPSLNRHVAVYYRIQIDQPVVEDLERADVGYLRFFRSGKGTISYARGETDNAHHVALHGPSTETGAYVLEGPLDCFGAVLLPDFWTGIVDAQADECANRCLDARDFFGDDIQALYDHIAGLESFEDMAKALDSFLLMRITMVSADHRKVIDGIGDWLRLFPIPAPDALHDMLHKSERQVTRLANRHFGAPPKMLARKYRALRTASRLIGNRGNIPPELIDEYSDRAHMSREIKHFTGLSPRQLQINANPIVLATLHPDNFRAEAPWT